MILARGLRKSRQPAFAGLHFCPVMRKENRSHILSPENLLNDMRILSPTRSRDTPPAEFRISAHRSFDFIPPIDMLLSSVPVAIRRCSSVTPSTSEMRSPREPSGFGRMSPSTVVRMMARSDRVMEASRAARISLSPNLSSSTETGSFSLMIGRTSCASSDSMQFSAFRCRSRERRSSAVSRICAAWNPSFAHSAS